MKNNELYQIQKKWLDIIVSIMDVTVSIDYYNNFNYLYLIDSAPQIMVYKDRYVTKFYRCVVSLNLYQDYQNVFNHEDISFVDFNALVINYFSEKTNSTVVECIIKDDMDYEVDKFF